MCFELTQKKFKAQTAICDDVMNVTGHSDTSMKDWNKQVYGK